MCHLVYGYAIEIRGLKVKVTARSPVVKQEPFSHYMYRFSAASADIMFSGCSSVRAMRPENVCETIL